MSVCCDTVQLTGSIRIANGSATATCGVAAQNSTFSLSLASTYAAAFSSDLGYTFLSPLEFVTPGCATSLSSIEMLYMRCDAPLTLRIGGAVARVVGVAGTYPTLFAGGETMTVAIDGGAVNTVTFQATDQSLTDVVERVNSELVLAGLPPAVYALAVGSQLAIQGLKTGPEGIVNITGGTALATLGLTAGTSLGAGSDMVVNGSVGPIEFYKVGAPTTIQVKGVANAVTILVAGQPA